MANLLCEGRQGETNLRKEELRGNKEQTQEMAGGKLRGMIRKLKLSILKQDTKHGSTKCKTDWVLYQQNTDTSHGNFLGLIILCAQYSVKERKNIEESELGEGNGNHNTPSLSGDCAFLWYFPSQSRQGTCPEDFRRPPDHSSLIHPIFLWPYPCSLQ